MKASPLLVLVSIFFLGTVCHLQENCESSSQCLNSLNQKPEDFIVFISKQQANGGALNAFRRYCSYSPKTCIFFENFSLLKNSISINKELQLERVESYFIMLKRIDSQIYKFVLQTQNHYISAQNIKLFVEQTENNKWLQYYSKNQLSEKYNQDKVCKFIEGSPFNRADQLRWNNYTFNVIFGYSPSSQHPGIPPFNVSFSQYCRFAQIFKNSKIIRFGYFGDMREYIHFEKYKKYGSPTIKILYQGQIFPIFQQLKFDGQIETKDLDVFYKLIEKVCMLSKYNLEKYISIGQLMSFYFYTLMKNFGYYGPPPFTDLKIPQNYKELQIYYPTVQQVYQFQTKWVMTIQAYRQKQNKNQP